MRLLPKISKNAVNHRTAELEREMIRREAKIGGTLFGKIPQGHNRQFFCLDETTWVWHEEWTDTHGNKQVRTTRYDVREDSMVKVQDGRHYQKVSDDEARKLYKAAKLYQKRVNNELYKSVLPQ